MQRIFEQRSVEWDELSELSRVAPPGDKRPQDLKIVFSNSRYKCFVYDDGRLIDAGRALADGIDCSYLWDIAIHPDQRGAGLGKAIITTLKELSAGHRKIFLYANPGKEGFYRKLGFLRMRTARAIFSNQDRALRAGLVEETRSRFPLAVSAGAANLHGRRWPDLRCDALDAPR